MSHPVFRCRLSFGQRHCPAHLILVAFQQRDVVSDESKNRRFQLTFRGALKCALRFVEAVRQEIAVCKIGIQKRQVGIRRDGSLGCVNRSFKATCPVRGKAPQ